MRKVYHQDSADIGPVALSTVSVLPRSAAKRRSLAAKRRAPPEAAHRHEAKCFVSNRYISNLCPFICVYSNHKIGKGPRPMSLRFFSWVSSLPKIFPSGRSQVLSQPPRMLKSRQKKNPGGNKTKKVRGVKALTSAQR